MSMNSTDFEKYLKDRFTSQLHWYEAKSEYLKNTYKIVTITTYLVCSVLPILIYFFAHSKLIPITVSLLIILLFSFDKFFRLQEKWLNYRSTAELLKKEMILFQAAIGEYSEVESKKAFIDNIERIISRENTVWISTLENKTKPYKIFITHNWEYEESYLRLINMFNETPHFYYKNCSISDHAPVEVENSTKLTELITDQIKFVDCILVIANKASVHSNWINKEIEIAKTFGKPIISIQPWGQESIPKSIEEISDIIVSWNRDSIVNAIKSITLSTNDLFQRTAKSRGS